MFFPRVAIVLVLIFSDFLQRAYEGLFWPVLGFIFMPLTVLAYAWAVNSNEGSVSGIYLVGVVVAAIMDLGLTGTGASARRGKLAVSRKKKLR